MGSINKHVSRYEISAVYTHPAAKADIVLVHGLNGDPERTWTAPTDNASSSGSGGVFWPADLLPASLKGEPANVLVYGYNADVFHASWRRADRVDRLAGTGSGTGDSGGPSDNFIHQHAQSLVASLTHHRVSEGTARRPIIWVAHSLGGIVVKRALLYSNDLRAEHQDEYRGIYTSTYAIVFLGTPHTGSDLAGWARVLQAMSDAVVPRRFFETEPVLLRALRKDGETLQAINSHFLDIYQKYRIHMVHENHKTDIKGTKVFIVDQGSASPQLPGVTYYGIEATHSGMCKFESDSAPGYRIVSAAIREWVHDAPEAIEVRWIVEEQDRKARVALENYERMRPYIQHRTGTSYGKTGQEVVQYAGPGHSIAETTSLKKPPMVEAPPPIPLLPDSNAIVPSPVAIVEELDEDEGGQVIILDAASSQDHNEEDRGRRTAGSGKQADVEEHPSPSEPLFIHPEPFRPNSFFIGRDEELKTLHKMLLDPKRRSEGTSAVLIQCLPGGGKTHLARQYVFQHRRDYPGGIFWVRAKSRQEMEYWYWRIARNEAVQEEMAGPDDSSSSSGSHGGGGGNDDDGPSRSDPRRTVALVRRWLSGRQGWLLVLDGIRFDYGNDNDDNDDNDHTSPTKLLDFIPDARNSGLIYTSTERAVTGEPALDNPRVMELGLVSARHATELLLLEMDKRQPWTHDDRARALELVQLMGRLPLMIHVAAQHLKATREPLSKYLRSYKTRPNAKAGGLLAYKAVLEGLQNRGANAALNLISILAFLDHHVPVEMVTLGLSALDKITPVKTSDASHRHSTLNNTLKVLIAFGLVERSETDDHIGGPVTTTSSRSSKRSLDNQSSSNGSSHHGHGSSGGGSSSEPRHFLDVLRIHSIVQAFFIDTLNEAGEIDFWLEHAVAVWCRSYDEADRRVRECDVLCDDAVQQQQHLPGIVIGAKRRATTTTTARRMTGVSSRNANRKTGRRRVGLPDDYRRFCMHGQKLREHLRRFEKKNPGVLAPCREQVNVRLERISLQMDDAIYQTTTTRMPNNCSDNTSAAGSQDGAERCEDGDDNDNDGGDNGDDNSVQQPPISVFERANSGSESDSLATPASQQESAVSWEGGFRFPPPSNGEGAIRDARYADSTSRGWLQQQATTEGQSPVAMYTPRPSNPYHWHVPYPLVSVMPVPEELDGCDDQTSTVVPNLGQLGGNVGVPPSNVQPTARPAYNRAPASGRIEQLAGGWHDCVLGDPRVSISREVVRGSMSSPKQECDEAQRKNAFISSLAAAVPGVGSSLAAQSEAEVQLSKIKKATAATASSSSSAGVASTSQSSAALSVLPSSLRSNPNYMAMAESQLHGDSGSSRNQLTMPMLGGNSSGYRYRAEGIQPQQQKQQQPIAIPGGSAPEFISGLAGIVSSPTSWTVTALKRLRENLTPGSGGGGGDGASSADGAYFSSSAPERSAPLPVTEGANGRAPTNPAPIFRSSHSAGSNLSHAPSLQHMHSDLYEPHRDGGQLPPWSSSSSSPPATTMPGTGPSAGNDLQKKSPLPSSGAIPIPQRRPSAANPWIRPDAAATYTGNNSSRSTSRLTTPRNPEYRSSSSSSPVFFPPSPSLRPSSPATALYRGSRAGSPAASLPIAHSQPQTQQQQQQHQQQQQPWSSPVPSPSLPPLSASFPPPPKFSYRHPPNELDHLLIPAARSVEPAGATPPRFSWRQFTGRRR